MAIEVERKGLLDEQTYQELPDLIRSLGGEDLGDDDTETIFYVTETSQLKVQIRNSKEKAKLAWKSGGLDGSTSRKEIEVGVMFEDAKAAEQLVDELMPGARKVPTAQRRHDFTLDGISIALKYSDHWKHHVELDTNVDSEQAVSDALERIQKVADKLHVSLLTAEEEKNFTAQLLAKL